MQDLFEQFKRQNDSLRSFCSANSIPYNRLYRYTKKHCPDCLSRKGNGLYQSNKEDQLSRRADLPSKEDLTRMYYEEDMSMEEIGNFLDRSAATVHYYFKELGIPAKTKSEIMKKRMSIPENIERLRSMANEGKIGVFSRDWHTGHKDTWIEVEFARWCEENGIQCEAQFQIDPDGHRYDFLLSGTNILVETDGEYFHNRPEQRAKDTRHEEEAKRHGYTVYRFTDKEIKKSQSKCFDVLKEQHNGLF